MIGIYRIVNRKNNKCYIGQSTAIDYRINTHFVALREDKHRNASGLRDKLQNAWNKYGEDNFYWEILEECSKDSLDEREKYWINFYNSFSNGYNQTIGGEGGDTFTYKSDEDKKITKDRRVKKLVNRITITDGINEKRVYENEYIEKYRDNGWYIGLSEDHKRKLKENHKGFTGLKKTPEHNEKLRQRFKGIPLSEEHKRKLSESHMGYVMPDEQKRKIGESNKGRKMSEDNKRKLVESHKRNKGKIVVNNGKICKYIQKSELDKYLSEGYIRGYRKGGSNSGM